MNSYEASAVVHLDSAHEVIMGQKVIDPLTYEDVLGVGYRWVETDIDESDE